MVGAAEISLAPADPEGLGDWARVVQAVRLYPTLPSGSVRFDGPSLSTQLFGEVALGRIRYPLLLGVTPTNEVGLWVDQDGDRRLTAEEKLSGTRVAGGLAWSLTLTAAPNGGEDYDYPLQILWPEGRGYVFLVAQVARAGTFQGRRVVVVDGDLDGVFGTKGDFLGVDVDEDGTIYADPDGHERFSLAEAFTLGQTSYRVEWLAPDGRRLRLSSTAYVPPKVPLIPGSPAPDFSFRNFLDGKEISLGSLRGKVVLLDFWATWCGPCMQSLPELLALYAEFQPQGLEIVGVSLDESAEDLRRVITAYGISWPVAFEGRRWDNRVAGLYRVYQIPTAYLIDKDGVIRFRDPKGAGLRKAVQELLAKPVAQPMPTESPLPSSISAGPILEIHVPQEVGLRLGEEAALLVRVVNTSAYLAEEIRIGFPDLPAGVAAKLPPAFNLPAFGEHTVEVVLNASGLRPEAFPLLLRLSVDYHYCIGEACFQMAQEAATTAVLGAARGFVLPPWWILLVLGAGVLLSWVVFGRALAGLLVVLLAVAGFSLAIGIYFGQARQAQRIGGVLCTSCIGIAEAKDSQAELAPALRAAFSELSRPVHLVVFYTPWCRACPYAKAVAAEIAASNPLISVEFVDADSERKKAEAAGVVRDGKAIVPAILVRESGAVIFGTADLAQRILAALKGEP